MAWMGVGDGRGRWKFKPLRRAAVRQRPCRTPASCAEDPQQVGQDIESSEKSMLQGWRWRLEQIADRGRRQSRNLGSVGWRARKPRSTIKVDSYVQNGE